MLEKISYLYLLTSVLLIVTIRYGYRYISTYVGMILILLFLINLKKNIRIFRKYKSLLISTLLFIVFLIIQFIFVNINEKGYIIHKIIPYGVFIVFLIQTKVQKEKLIKLFFYCALCATLLSLILNILQIDYLELGHNFRYYTKQMDVSIYGEERLSGLFSHKSRFGLILCMALMVGLNLKIKNLYKILLALFLFVAMMFANTKTFLLTFIWLIILKLILLMVDKYSIRMNMNFIKKNLMKILVAVSSVSVIILFIIYKISLTRNIFTLGSRTEIWSYAIDYIRMVPQGTVRIPSDLAFNNILYYNNAHSTFLNEVIESGVVGGIIYLIFIIITLFSIEDKYYKYAFCTLLIFSQMDSVIYNEIVYIFFPLFSLMVNENSKDNSKLEVELIDEMEEIS